MLELTPNFIEFTENEQFALKITNTLNDSLVAFKLMLTTPKAYTVKPRMGTIPPGGSIDVTIFRLQPFSPKDKFRVQGIPISPDQDTQDAALLEQLFKNEKNKDLIKNHPLKAKSSSGTSADAVSSATASQEEQQERASTQQPQQQQEESSSLSSWGSWGGDWFSSKLVDVVSTVQDSANALGSKIQHFVDEEIVGSDEQQQQQQSSGDNSSATTATSAENDRTEQELANEESVFMDVIETAEKSFFSLVGWGKETLGKVSEAEEIQNLKKAASSLTQSTKSATLNLYDQIATNLGIRGDDDALLRITFEDLFREGEASRFYEELNSLSMRSQTRLDAIMNKLSKTERKNAKTILKAIDSLLSADDCWSDTVPTTGDIENTANGKELLQFIVRARENCAKVLENYREMSNGTLAEQIQTGIIVIEKLRTEFLRTLALFAGKNFEQVAQLSQLVYHSKKLDELEIPAEWTTAEQSEKEKELSKHERLAHILRNYSLFATSQLVQVAQEYATTAQAVQSIVDAEYNKVSSDEESHEETQGATHMREKAVKLVANLLQQDVPQYTSKDSSIVRESPLFFAHILKCAAAHSLHVPEQPQANTEAEATTTTTSDEQKE